jgi:hypothetical protein
MSVHPFIADVTIPFIFGIPQIILLIVGLIGLGLLIHVFHRGVIGQHDKFTGKRQRRFFWGRAISGSILLLIAISLIYIAVLLQTYLALSSEIKVATVRASQLSNVPNYMVVDITLFDQHGNTVHHESDGLCGNEWELQGDIVRMADWTTILGLHTGYKLTRLEGRYDDPSKETDWYHSVVVLNGGDDNFFTTLKNQGGWLKPVVQASYGNAIILPADGNTYNVYVSQTGLTTKGPTSLAHTSAALAIPAIGHGHASGPDDCRQLH